MVEGKVNQMRVDAKMAGMMGLKAIVEDPHPFRRARE